MESIVLETRYDPPVDFSWALSGSEGNERVASCMKLHRVRRQVSYLARDGARQLCVFLGRDAESVRIAVRSLGYKSSTTWTATVHGPVPPTVEAPSAIPSDVVVVERRFEAPRAFEDLGSLEDEVGGERLRLHKVSFLHSLFARDRTRMVCLYAAPDAETVCLLQRQTGIPYETAWKAMTFPQTAEEMALGPLVGEGTRRPA